MKTLTRACCVLAGSLAVASLLCACGSAQSRMAGYVREGQKLYAAGNYEKARLEYRNVIQIDPRNTDAHLMLARIAEKTSDARAALAQYQAVLAIDAANIPARAALGRLYLLGGLPDKALEAVEPGLSTDPKNAQFLVVRGGARAQLGNQQGAMDDAQAAVAQAPDDQFAVALLASLYKRQSQLDKASEVIKAGIERLPNSVDLRTIMADLDAAQSLWSEAEVQLRAVVALEPNVLAHRYALAHFYLVRKDVDGAEKVLRETVQSAPKSAEAKVQLVQFLFAQRGTDQGVTQIDQFLKSDASDDKLQLALGELLMAAHKPDLAEHAYRAVIAHAGTNPDGLTARNHLAGLLLVNKDTKGASALIAEVLNSNARDNDALILRSEIEMGRNDAQSAIGDLRAVLRDQPNAIPIMRTLARAYRLNNETDLAEETLRSAVQISPKDFDCRFDLSQVLLGAGKLDQADTLLEQLSKENASNIPVLESLYRVQAGQKRYAEAMTTAQNVQRVNPKAGLGYYLAGLIEETNEKPDRALADYKEALQRQPDAAEPLTAIVHLEVPRKHVDAAMAEVDAVIARAPNDGVAHNLKAELLLLQHHNDAAIAAYQDTVRVAPLWDRGYQGLALAQALDKHSDEAIATLKLGIDKTQGSPGLVSELSDLYNREGKSDQSIALYEGLLTHNPNSSFAANNLAMLLVNYRQDPSSLARAQKLAEQLAGSTDVSLIDTRGWVRFKSGDFHGAEALLQEAVDKSPTSPEMRYHLGMAQLSSGEEQAAEQNLESAISSNRPFVGMDEAKAALARLKKVASLG